MRAHGGTTGCATCGAPVARDQRYCLHCGARLGSKGPLLTALLARLRETPVAPVPAATPPSSESPATPRAGLRVPSRPMSATLLALFLGFGVLIGAVTGAPPSATLAAADGQHLKLLLPPKATTTSQEGAAASSGEAEESEPPESEPEETPAPSSSEASSSSTGTKESEEEGKEESESGSGSEQQPLKKLPPVKHVFVIVLSDQPYAALFGPEAQAHYLARTLEKKGELLVRYDAVAHEQLANEIALVSGQGPTPETEANCPNYAPVAPAGAGANGQVLGDGCVYPAQTKTIANQLTAKRLTWRAYVQGSDEAGGGPAACSHPTLGSPDPTSGLAAPSGAYATFKDPFVYFQSITGVASCTQNVVGLAKLKGDLAKPASTPSFAYIAPDRCHDGAPTPCGVAGASGGPGGADAFVKQVVPEILASKAYKQNGLLVITTDEAPSSGEYADSSSCCGQPAFPNLPASGGPRPKGGGAVGALLLSPFVKGGTTTQEPFNHFALLRTFEDLLHLPHLGYAAATGVKALPPALFVEKPKG